MLPLAGMFGGGSLFSGDAGGTLPAGPITGGHAGPSSSDAGWLQPVQSSPFVVGGAGAKVSSTADVPLLTGQDAGGLPLLLLLGLAAAGLLLVLMVARR